MKKEEKAYIFIDIYYVVINFLYVLLHNPT